MKLFSFLLFFLSFFISQAQDLSITGKVVDAESNAVLEFASVSLLSASDSTLVRGVSTGFEGELELKASSGDFILRVDYMGYESLFREIQLQNSDLQLGNVALRSDGQMLNEVTVLSAKNFLRPILIEELTM